MGGWRVVIDVVVCLGFVLRCFGSFRLSRGDTQFGVRFAIGDGIMSNSNFFQGSGVVGPFHSPVVF